MAGPPPARPAHPSTIDPSGSVTEMAADLDRIDRRILDLLTQDGRLPHAAIAKEVGLSGPAIHERVRKLEDRGVITKYTAVLDPDLLERPHAAFVLVTLSEGAEFAADEPIVEKISAEPDVLEFHRVAGEDCYLIKTRTATNKDLERLLRRIRSLKGVARTRTTIVLSTELECATVCVPEETGAHLEEVV